MMDTNKYKLCSFNQSSFQTVLKVSVGVSLFMGISLAAATLDAATPQAASSPEPSLSAPTSQGASQGKSLSATFESHSITLSSAEPCNGAINLLTLSLTEKENVKGDFAGKPLHFFPIKENTQKGAVFAIPYDFPPGPAHINLVFSSGPSDSPSKTFQLKFQVIDGKYPSEVLKVDGRRVNPTNPKDLARIERDIEEVKQIYQQITLKKYWEGPFQFPLKSAITSVFGTKRVYNGALKNFHPGTDFRAPLGTPVFADAPGKVVMAKNLFYTGNTVMIDHGYGVVTLYAHLSEMNVKKDQEVKVSQLLGKSGKTGRVNGPHLHWQAVINGVKGRPDDLVHLF